MSSKHSSQQSRRGTTSKPYNVTELHSRNGDSPNRTCSEAERRIIEETMRKMLNGREPRPFQLDVVRAQQERRDVVCHAATGMGKTVIAAGPHGLPGNEGKITIMISPLIGLQNEMVESFSKEYAISAVAVNSSHGNKTMKKMQDIVSRVFQIVLVSPEMLLSRRFINKVIRHSGFVRRVYSVVIDEAHCISHWGASFRKKYASIGIIRAFLPKNTPIVALSASLTRRVIRDIKEKLQISKNCLDCNLGNDRPNVSLVVRPMHNIMETYTDLDFVVPLNVHSAREIKKTWIYADNISVGNEIIDHLQCLLPDDLTECICPYNAVLSHEYRKLAMEAFRAGSIRILVCTDAAGMGCNIPDVEVVVQWKLLQKLSSFVQRAGRAARGPGTTGLAVLLVETSAYTVVLPESTTPTAPIGSKQSSTKKNIDDTTWKKIKAPKGYAEARGRLRGGLTRKDEFKWRVEVPPIDRTSEHEGLFNLVQATTCRREVIQEAFDNPKPKPSVPCCDICNPELLDHTRPGRRNVKKSKKKVSLNKKSGTVINALIEWREEICKRDFGGACASSALLPDAAIEHISASYPFSQLAIKDYFEPQWVFWYDYADELTKLILSVEIEKDLARNAAHGKAPTKGHSSKRTLDTGTAPQKRQRRGQMNEGNKNFIAFMPPTPSPSLSRTFTPSAPIAPSTIRWATPMDSVSYHNNQLSHMPHEAGSIEYPQPSLSCQTTQSVYPITPSYTNRLARIRNGAYPSPYSPEIFSTMSPFASQVNNSTAQLSNTISTNNGHGSISTSQVAGSFNSPLFNQYQHP